METDVLAGVTLVLLFVLGSLTRVNIGALGLVAAFLFGSAVHQDAATVAGGFPSAFFILIVGVTYLFSVASANGTMDWILGAVSRLVGGRSVALPTGLFVVATAVSAFGAPAQAGIAMLSPIGIRLSGTIGLSPFVMAIAVVLGVLGGSFSPLNILGLVANGSLRSAGLEPHEGSLFLASVATTAVVLGVVLTVERLRVGHNALAGPSVNFGTMPTRHLGRPSAVGPDWVSNSSVGDASPSTDVTPRSAEEGGKERTTWTVISTLIGVATVLLGSMLFELDLGFLALTVAVLLHLLFPHPESSSSIAWDVVVLICGLVTFISVVERAGTLDRVGDALTGAGAPLAATFLICLSAALVSAFASSTATIGASMALIAPLVVDGGVGVVGATIALCLSATLVDASPFSSVGALTVAGAPKAHAPRLFRQLFTWGLAMILIGPILTCSVFVWAPSLW